MVDLVPVREKRLRTPGEEGLCLQAALVQAAAPAQPPAGCRPHSGGPTVMGASCLHFCLCTRAVQKVPGIRAREKTVRGFQTVLHQDKLVLYWELSKGPLTDTAVTLENAERSISPQEERTESVFPSNTRTRSNSSDTTGLGIPSAPRTQGSPHKRERLQVGNLAT